MEKTSKWSQEYKDSINCDDPKGFSQRAHCQGLKKKKEKSPTTTGIERQKRVWCEWGAFLLYGHKCLYGCSSLHTPPCPPQTHMSLHDRTGGLVAATLISAFPVVSEYGYSSQNLKQLMRKNPLF